MRYLLDTHTFLWFVRDDPNLGRTAKTLIEDVRNETLLSAASVWELAIKVRTGKLVLAEPFGTFVPREIATNQLTILPSGLAHAALVCTLPLHHRDPFDRMLIAQSLVEGLPILGVDTAFDAYGVTRFW